MFNFTVDSTIWLTGNWNQIKHPLRVVYSLYKAIFSTNILNNIIVRFKPLQVYMSYTYSKINNSN
uniref:Uncharacterized protein n=1 Tax=Arundo donax TaxID=35708 RepID=A0A0A9HZC7_ARUDO